MNQLTEFQRLSVETAIVKLLKQKHFSICDFDSISKVLGKEQIQAGEDYHALRTMHCVDYADMKNGLDKMVKLKVLEMLGFSENIMKDINEEPVYYKREENEEPAKTKRSLISFWKVK